jgi:hypothetical protein
MVDAQSEAKEDQDARSEDGHAWILLTQDLSSALTVMKGRMQLLRRRLHQGGDAARLETDLNAIETELARLMTTVERVNRRDGCG